MSSSQIRAAGSRWTDGVDAVPFGAASGVPAGARERQTSAAWPLSTRTAAPRMTESCEVTSLPGGGAFARSSACWRVGKVTITGRESLLTSSYPSASSLVMLNRSRSTLPASIWASIPAGKT